jgi:hypothetical protein
MRPLKELAVEDMPQQQLRKIRKKNFNSQNSNLSPMELLNSDPKYQLTSEVSRG